MKKLLCGAVVLCLTGSAFAASISGSTDFKVTIPPILVLYHWDEAHLTLTGGNMDIANDSDEGFEVSDKTVRTGNLAIGGSSYTFSGDDVDDSTLPTGFGAGATKIHVKLENSWAVRSIASGDVELALSMPKGENLTHDSGSGESIEISGEKLVSGSREGSTLTLPPQWDPSTKGDIEFDLNLTNATKPGTYNSRGSTTAGAEDDDTFKLVLTGN